MNYFTKFVDMHDTASSKIFLGLVFATVTVILIGLKVWLETIPMELLYFTGGMTSTMLGLSTVDRFTGKQDGSNTTNGN